MPTEIEKLKAAAEAAVDASRHAYATLYAAECDLELANTNIALLRAKDARLALAAKDALAAVQRVQSAARTERALLESLDSRG